MNTAVNPHKPKMDPPQGWSAGSGEVEITPSEPVYLYGYPHTPRESTAVNDPLCASAFWLEHGHSRCLWIGLDLIWVSRQLADRIRQAIGFSLGLPVCSIMISTTHTHSGPVTTRMLSNRRDRFVPDPDPAYLDRVLDAAVAAAGIACSTARTAELRLGHVASSGLGGNRRIPDGPTYARWPVLFAITPGHARPFAIMSVCAMHPTVLHQDSTLISGDFPGLARQSLKQTMGADTHYLHHLGASGNLSPRRAVTANTLDEAKRLGELLAQRVHSAFADSQPLSAAPIRCSRAMCDLPARNLPDLALAARACEQAKARFEQLRRQGAAQATVRTAEVDWFGAEETLALVQARDEGHFAPTVADCLPAEVQVVGVGRLILIGWPGEVFVEFAQRVTDRFPSAHIITLANGDLQGYLVTQEAIEQGAYEAGNAVFASPESGDLLVETTLKLLSQLEVQADPTTLYPTPDIA